MGQHGYMKLLWSHLFPTRGLVPNLGVLAPFHRVRSPGRHFSRPYQIVRQLIAPLLASWRYSSSHSSQRDSFHRLPVVLSFPMDNIGIDVDVDVVIGIGLGILPYFIDYY